MCKLAQPACQQAILPHVHRKSKRGTVVQNGGLKLGASMRSHAAIHYVSLPPSGHWNYHEPTTVEKGQVAQGKKEGTVSVYCISFGQKPPKANYWCLETWLAVS